MMIRKNSWLLGLIFTLNVQAQEFDFSAEVQAIPADAYYRIDLSPELLGQLRLDHADLRLYDSEGQEQPYLLRKEQAVATTSLFKTYEIVDKAYKKDAISHLIFNNPEKEAIDNISFVVKNTDVQKRARLSGSDDQENWYVIKNNYLLHAMKSADETTELKILNFPLSDYAYFKLEIDDNWKLPINILQVGYYDTQRTKGLSTTFDCPVAEQKDSLKTTFLKLEFLEKKYVEKLRFEVSGADYYSRNTTVLIKKERLNKKKRTVTYFEKIGAFELNSNSLNEVTFRGISTDALYVEIDNKDNAPLKIERIEGAFLNRYLVAKLKAEAGYTLKFGDEMLRAPEYDMANFSDQIPRDAKRVIHGQIASLKATVDTKQAEGPMDSPYLIWIVIGGVGIVLAFVSTKMIKEISQK